MSKINYFLKLLDLSYIDLVQHLIQKYGEARDDYYRENSYKRFLKGEIKSITKGKFARSKEGLFCHHVYENKSLKLSDIDFIKKNKYPYRYQKKENLVYCDLIEHLILHAVIAKETNLEFGFPGFSAYIAPMIIEWYIDEKIPSPPWQQVARTKAIVTPEEAIEILYQANKSIGKSFPRTLNKYLEEEQRKSEEQAKKWEEFREKRRKRTQEEFDKIVKKIREMKKNNVRKLSRKEVLENFYHYKKLLYEMNSDFDNPTTFQSYKEFEKEMLPVIKDDILDRLYSKV